MPRAEDDVKNRSEELSGRWQSAESYISVHMQREDRHMVFSTEIA